MFRVVQPEKLEEYGFENNERKLDLDCWKSTVCWMDNNNYLRFKAMQHPDQENVQSEFTFHLEWLYKMIKEGIIIWEK